MPKSTRQWLIATYKRLYFSHFRCASALRLPRYLPSSEFNREVYFVKNNDCHIVYHSIPKTGCTTVKLLLLDAIGQPLESTDTVDVHRRTNYSVALENSDNYMYRVAISLHRKGCKPSPDLPGFDNALQFAFVRNPWARLVSSYNDKVLGNIPHRFQSFQYAYPHIKFERMTFSDFVRFVCRVPNDLCEPHFRRQSDFFTPGAVDFVGRIERFSDDLTELITRAGLDRRLLKWTHIKTNETGNSNLHYTDFYTAKTSSLVARKYAEDIDRFGYRFSD